jgi:hypothetical protein
MISLPTILGPSDHDHNLDEHCPWCDQPIPHERFAEIHNRIQAKERERTEEVQRQLEEQFKERTAQEREKYRAEAEKAQKAAAREVETAKHEGAALAEKARIDEREAMEALNGPKFAAAEAAKTAAEQALAASQETQELTIGNRLLEQRNALEQDKAKAVNAEKSKAFNDRQKLEEKLQLMQRQLQKQRADELGEGAEIDLFDELKREFPRDDITRVGKGVEGADIIHKVINSGRECGCIVYDCKNRSSWRGDYVTKLRRDQLAAKADHAILASNAFPAGTRQLHYLDGVILASPARVVVLAAILRKQIVQSDSLRLSTEARSQKMARVYEFITSEHCAQLFDHIDTVTDDMLELDVAEKKKHDATWRRRGELIRSVQQARGDLAGEIDRIVTAPVIPMQRVK